jgi:DNA-binding transcriptional MerR regulator
MNYLTIDINPNKLYFTIGEVAIMFDVNTSLVRFWEKEFDIIKPHKNKKGNRMFTQQDVRNFQVIYHLVKEQGYTLQGAKDKLKDKESKQEHNKNIEVLERLQVLKNKLTQLKSSL